MAVKNRIQVFRKRAGLTQAELAEAIGISRQAYAAIEVGRAVPSTEVALRLARRLQTTVEELFHLDDSAPETLEADLIGADSVPAGTRVRLIQVGPRLLARPLIGEQSESRSLVPADGTVTGMGAGKSTLRVRPESASRALTLALMGCDPSISLVDALIRERGVRIAWTEAASRASLQALARGEAHIAGCHFRDKTSGSYNLPLVKSLVPFPCTLVRFAMWQEGLIVAAGNPKSIRGVDDLARPDVTMINRQEGSGARGLLHRLMNRAGLTPGDIKGYDQCVNGHMELARQIRLGTADCGIGVKAAARANGLDFLLLDEEPYDLVIPNHFLELPAVRSLLDVIKTPELRRQVEALGGYDTTSMGLLYA